MCYVSFSSLGIIIDAEGAFNLDAEKCNNDSIIDCAMVLNDYFKIGDDYVKQVEAAVFKTKGSSGLYIWFTQLSNSPI